MKEFCSAFIIDLDSDFEEKKSQLSECSCKEIMERKRRSERLESISKKMKMKPVNQGFKTLFEEETKNEEGKQNQNQDKFENQEILERNLKDIQEEDFEILDKVLNGNLWNERCCPHCLSIDEIESMLKKEAEKFVEINENVIGHHDDDYDEDEHHGQDQNQKSKNELNSNESCPASSSYDLKVQIKPPIPMNELQQNQSEVESPMEGKKNLKNVKEKSSSLNING